jgi:mRNA-degrading endonuclease RelE of RelBE toxin-antitoxin system
MRLSIDKPAFKFLQHADIDTFERIFNALINICTEVSKVDVKRLAGRGGERRARVGKYRIVYIIDDDAIIVRDIDSRGQVYK